MTKPCPICAGDGGWTERVDESSVETVWVRCSKCGGTGSEAEIPVVDHETVVRISTSLEPTPNGWLVRSYSRDGREWQYRTRRRWFAMLIYRWLRRQR